MGLSFPVAVPQGFVRIISFHYFNRKTLCPGSNSFCRLFEHLLAAPDELAFIEIPDRSVDCGFQLDLHLPDRTRHSGKAAGLLVYRYPWRSFEQVKPPILSIGFPALEQGSLPRDAASHRQAAIAAVHRAGLNDFVLVQAGRDFLDVRPLHFGTSNIG